MDRLDDRYKIYLWHLIFLDGRVWSQSRMREVIFSLVLISDVLTLLYLALSFL